MRVIPLLSLSVPYHFASDNVIVYLCLLRACTMTTREFHSSRAALLLSEEHQFHEMPRLADLLSLNRSNFFQHVLYVSTQTYVFLIYLRSQMAGECARSSPTVWPHNSIIN
jgi:hypothetical protein